MTIQETIEAGDVALTLAGYFKQQIILTEAEVAYYERTGATGGYLLISRDFRFVTRGGHGSALQLEVARDALKSNPLQQFHTQKDAEAAQAKWNANHTGDDFVVWYTRAGAVQRLLGRLKLSLSAAETTARALSDPYFDASPAAQDFEANEGRYL